MGNYCSGCGTATGGAKFCPNCGSAQTSAAPPGASPTRPQTASPYPAAKRGSPVLKIVLIAIAVLLLLGVIGAVRAFFYVRERVHEQVAQLKEGGGNLRDAIAGAASALPTHAGCELLSRDRVAAMLGSPVERAEGNEAGDTREFCDYWSGSKTADGDAEQTYRTKRGAPDIKDLDSFIKGIKVSNSGKGPLLSVNVFRGNGKIAIYGVRTAALLSGHGAQNFEGPWDEAYFGPFDAVMAVRRGDNAIVLDLSKLAAKREKGEAIAKAMVDGF